MLPDYPDVKEELAQVVTAFLADRVQFHLGVIGQGPRMTLFEGERHQTTRPDGRVRDMEFKSISAELLFENRELATISLDSLFEKLDGIAQEMAAQQARHVYEQVGAAAEEVGNVVDGAGAPLTADMLLDVLETIYLDFDRQGRPLMPSLHIHPDNTPAIERIVEEAKGSEELSRRHAEVMRVKKEEWRAREASRRLVG